MVKKIFAIVILVYLLAVCSCARRGSITGGPKDTLSPVLELCKPENFSTNFKGDKFEVTFDELVVLKNISKQLLVSPPMKNDPIISPTSASYFINVKILDTLEPNTTYCFNFGQSIVDNNEGNPYNLFKYVFSTGTYIDSLVVKGNIRNAFDIKQENFVSVMLYEINEKYNDSTIYKEVPKYITNTLDSATTFQLENLKEGKYLLLALKDASRNNKYNAKSDKIAFYKNFITVPTDSTYELNLFTEKLPFVSKTPFLAAKNRIIVGYEGEIDLEKPNVSISLKNGDEDIKTIITKFPAKDSLQVWFPTQQADSLALEIKKDSYQKSYNVRMRKTKSDSLNITPAINGTLHLSERFKIKSATPLVEIDNKKMKLTKPDSTEVNFSTVYDEFYQELYFDFDKKQDEKYTLDILPTALTDLMEQTNDTLVYKFNTINETEYGAITIKLENVKQFPVIVEITDKEGKAARIKQLDNNEDINFKYMQPQSYKIRVIYDTNNNGKWDTGNFLQKLQPEEVIYFPEEINIRANWDIEQTFDLSIKETSKTEEEKEKPKTVIKK